MKISVITVTLNNEATIRATLESIVCQDYLDIEWIVIDGASSDRTLKCLNDANVRNVQIFSEPDNGIYDAMNKGLMHATGEIICFLNADDYYADSRVLSHVAERIKADELDVLMGDVAYFKKNKPNKIVRRYCSHRFTPERLAWGWMPAHPGFFMRRSVYQEVGLFNTQYRIAGDFDYMIRVFHNKALLYDYLPDVVVKMQAGGVSDGGLFNKIRLNYEVFTACRANGLQTNLFKILSKYPFKIAEYFHTLG